jgi:hypothetical protein
VPRSRLGRSAAVLCEVALCPSGPSSLVPQGGPRRPQSAEGGLCATHSLCSGCAAQRGPANAAAAVQAAGSVCLPASVASEARPLTRAPGVAVLGHTGEAVPTRPGRHAGCNQLRTVAQSCIHPGGRRTISHGVSAWPCLQLRSWRARPPAVVARAGLAGRVYVHAGPAADAAPNLPADW